jgi:hypothetical protein
MLVEDPAMIGTDLLVLGRQVPTSHGGYVDILGLDVDGRVHILELKRDKTPRDVVAQTLDYGSWAKELALDDIVQLHLDHHDGQSLDDAFADRFDQPLPDVINADQQFTIVASALDPTSDRIVEFLAQDYGVPINAVFFRHFNDDGREYLARTWLIAPAEVETHAARSSKRKVRTWNGRDFYVIQGRADQEEDRWEIARRYGLLNAGGGSWYWKPLRNLTPGARVFVYVGGAGYVGIGEITGALMPAGDAIVDVDGTPTKFADLPGIPDRIRSRAQSTDPEVVEMVVPVTLQVARPIDQAVSERGLFASQVTVCKLRDERTIETVEQEFSTP